MGSILPKFNISHATLARFLLCVCARKMFHVKHCHTDAKNMFHVERCRTDAKNKMFHVEHNIKC